MALIDFLTAAIISARTDYEKTFDSAVADAEKKKQIANSSFIGARLKEELAKIEEEKTSRIKEAKENAMAQVSSYASQIRNKERKEITNGTLELRSFQELEAIGRLTVTPEEFAALCGKYEKSGYWSKRLLNQIAEENGLPYSLGLSIDSKLKIVSDLVNGFSDYMELYAGKGKTDLSADKDAKVAAMMSDSALIRAARNFTAGDVLGTLSDDRMATAIYNSIKSSDAFSGAMKLKNFLENAPENSKNLLLLHLVGDSEIDGKVYKIAGVDADAIRKDYAERLEDYKTSGGKLEEVKVKLSQVNEYKNAKKDFDAAGLYQETLTDLKKTLAKDKNGYLLGMLKSEARNNEQLKEAGEDIGIIESEGGEDATN